MPNLSGAATFGTAMGETGTATFDAATERRGDVRVPVRAPATLRVADRPVDATIHDLSTLGCRVQSRVMLQPGARVTVGIGGVGTRAVSVTRAEQGAYGCRFDEPLAAESLRDAAGGGTLLRASFPDARALPRIGYLAIGAAVVTLPAALGWTLVARLLFG